ncbi:MAG: class I SAM-dependent rRNA methyltransferase [Planctomycetes bacterium]|nr:class I SAM-dependent rRNA methyltransferase [Planctomycetota bacterium]
MAPRSLIVPSPIAEKIAAGHPHIAIADLPQSGAAAEPATILWVRPEGGGDVLGTGIADPENGVVRLLAREALPALDLAFFRQRVRAAHDLRRALGLGDGHSAYRILNGAGDGVSGFAADVYAGYAVLYAYSSALLPFAREIAACLRESLGLEGVVIKVRPRGGAQSGKVKQEIAGAAPAEALIARENGVPFEVHLTTGMNVGLFTDMREHRPGFARYSAGKRVLNTFAYTGAFSVAAARAGAALVTSVDLSSGVLKWARENFRLSGLDPEDSRFEFITADVSRYLRSAAAEKKEYDAILIDPPTVSAARAAEWSAKNDYPRLIAEAAALLPESGGVLWMASNAHAGVRLDKTLEEGIAMCGRAGCLLETGGLPPDYPTPVGYREARYLQIAALWIC